MHRALFTAARVIMNQVKRSFALKTWVSRVAARAGVGRARVALARHPGVILHRIWADGTEFRFA